MLVNTMRLLLLLLLVILRHAFPSVQAANSFIHTPSINQYPTYNIMCIHIVPRYFSRRRSRLRQDVCRKCSARCFGSSDSETASTHSITSTPHVHLQHMYALFVCVCHQLLENILYTTHKAYTVYISPRSTKLQTDQSRKQHSCSRMV